MLTWVQLDFKDADSNGNFRLNHYHENYGYNLEAALEKYPIKELQNESHKENLINSLKKGNLQSATFVKDGQEIKQYVEANPQFKSVNVYDSNQKRVDAKQSKTEKTPEQENTTQAAKQAKGAKAAEGEDSPAGEDTQKKERRKSQKL